VPNRQEHYLVGLFEPQSVVVMLPEGEPPAWAGAMHASAPAAGRPVHLMRLVRKAQPPVEACDLVVVAVEAAQAAEALVVAATLHAKAALLLCDAPTAAEGERWLEFARRRGMRLLGPGSAGFVRPVLGLELGFLGRSRVAGDVALVSQSGALGSALLDWADESATGFSLALSLGAEVDVDIAEVLDYLATDRYTRSVIIYLEAVRNVRTFMSALRALAAIKPVIVLKGQRHDDARRGTLTHSGAIGGSNQVYEAALRRAGAVQIQIFAQIETTARYLATRATEVGNRLGVISIGHGPAVLAIDQALSNGLKVPALSADAARALAAALPGTVAANPLNLRTVAGAAELRAALDVFAADRGIDAILVILAPYRSPDLAALTSTLIAGADTVGKPVFACFMGGRQVRAHAQAAEAAGIPVFTTPEAAVNAHANLAVFHYNQQLLLQAPRPLSGLEAPDLSSARAMVDAVLSEQRVLLSEVESKALLDAFHIPVVATRTATSADEAVEIADAIGYPVVLKVMSPDVSHKSEVGGVVLNVGNGAEVRAQFEAIREALARDARRARFDGVTVQSMRSAPHGRELYIGVFRDPLWGPVMAFGAGGTRIEVMRDTTLEFAPLNRFLARRMIERTRIHRMLGSVRGVPAVALEAVERILLRVSEMVCELPELLEMDINPLIADEHGVVAVDARIVIDRFAPGGTRYAHMAIMPYPSYLERVHVTTSGQTCTIRPILPEDAENLQAFVRGLSPEARYFRFVSTLSELPPRMLVRFTQIDYSREVALVATVPRAPSSGAAGPNEQIVGVVRYMLNPDRRSCEFAVVIEDGFQGQGLGSRLMKSIIEIARSRGLARIEGFVLASNHTMLMLMQHLGFTIEADPQDPEMCCVGMALGPDRATRPAGTVVG
jgi:acetyltransferase